MRMKLNLAAEPFTNHRLLWAGVTVVLLSSLWVVTWVAGERAALRVRADEVAAMIKLQEEEVERIKAEQEKRKQEAQQVVMSREESLQLAAARLLIAQRSFSWDRLIREVERHVPNDTRITSIKVGDVLTSPDDAVAAVELKATGKTAAQMTEMMSNLEESGGLFLVRQATQEPPTEAREIPFTLLLLYRPARGGAL